MSNEKNPTNITSFEALLKKRSSTATFFNKVSQPRQSENVSTKDPVISLPFRAPPEMQRNLFWDIRGEMIRSLLECKRLLEGCDLSNSDMPRDDLRAMRIQKTIDIISKNLPKNILEGALGVSSDGLMQYCQQQFDHNSESGKEARASLLHELLVNYRTAVKQSVHADSELIVPAPKATR